MFLSQLRLNSRNRGVQRDLGSPNDMHKSLWRALPDQNAGGPGRALFRIEPLSDVTGSSPLVLVQSEKEPDWNQLPAGYVLSHETKPLRYSAEPDGGPDTVTVRAGSQFRFRLVANPTRKSDGKRHGLYVEEAQREWLTRKSELNGFQIVPNSLLVVPLGTLVSGYGDDGRSWFGVRFEGSLRVTDAIRFATTLADGIGSAKAFGFGLLSVAAR